MGNRKKKRKPNPTTNSQIFSAFEKMPEEMWRNIYSFINDYDLSQLALVSQKFHKSTTPTLLERKMRHEVLDYLAKQGLGFIENKYVFENLTTADTKKLLACLVELDRSITMGNNEFTYSRPISQEILDFLHAADNAVATYYYCCYATSVRNTTQGKVKIEQKEINELLNSIAEKNPAAYFLLAAHQIHPSIDCENRFENFKKGLKKLGVILTEENWDILQKNLTGWRYLNRYFFRPLQFFRGKAALKYAEEMLNESLIDEDNKTSFIINTLMRDGWVNINTNLQQFDAFKANIYNANVAALEFLQGKFHYKAATLRILSHPLFGDTFIQQLKEFQQKGKKKNPEAAMFKLLEEINENSEGLLLLFDNYPELIDQYNLTQIAKMDSLEIKRIMKKRDSQYKKPLNLWDHSTPSTLPQEEANEIITWYRNSLGPEFFPLPGNSNQSTTFDSDEDLDNIFNVI